MSLSATARERGIKYFLVSFCDLAGTTRAKLVPAGAIDAIHEEGASFAGFATWLDLTPADPDVFAIADPDSLIQLPWKPEVGWLAADLILRGQPLEQAPRHVLKTTLARLAEKGFSASTGVECEFFLLTPDGHAVADPRDTQSKPCYDQIALVRRYDLISEICDAMTLLGWEPYQNDHEDANGQFEMNWKYADALTTADRQVFFKYMVKSLAEKHGLRATFMPKPFTHLTGNGCHIHISLWDRETGANLFLGKPGATGPAADMGEGLTKLGHQCIAGVLDTAAPLCALIAPTVNSYRRLNAAGTLSGATWSPRTASVSGNNRTHMVRIPGPGRFEVRVADGSANPYLLPAAVLEACRHGMERGLSVGTVSDVNVYEGGTTDLTPLPTTLLDALRAFEATPVLRTALGEPFATAYLKHKHVEWLESLRHVSDWEREKTIDC
jgi:glutamate---methylamine ligase